MKPQKLARSVVLHGGYDDSLNQQHAQISQYKPTPRPATHTYLCSYSN